MSGKLTLTEHIREVAEAAKDFTNALVLKLTTSVIEAIEEIDKKVQDIRSDLTHYAEKPEVDTLRRDVEQNLGSLDQKMDVFEQQINAVSVDYVPKTQTATSKTPGLVSVPDGSGLKNSAGAISVDVDVVRGKKNLVDLSNVAQSRTYNVGLKLVNNRDGSLTVSGKCNGETNQIILTNMSTGSYSASDQISGTYITDIGDYTVTTGTNDPNIRIQVTYSDDGSTTANLYNGAGTGTLSYTVPHKNVWFRLLISAGAEFEEPVTFFPMICKKSLYDFDQTFQPYVMSNAELTQEIAALKAQLTQAAVLLPTGAVRPVITMQESTEQEDIEDVQTKTDEA